MAVPTTYGWVKVLESHVAKHWTTAEIDKAIQQELGSKADKADKYEIQRIAEKWQNLLNKKSVPKIKPRAKAEASATRASESLFREQLRPEEIRLCAGTLRGLYRLRPIVPNPVILGPVLTLSVLHAWNYYVARHYKDYSHLSDREARMAVAAAWNNMSLEEKNEYKEEYRTLLNQGKDILKGKIVDRETKLKATVVVLRAKERQRLRKNKAYEEELARSAKEDKDELSKTPKVVDPEDEEVLDPGKPISKW